MQTKKRKYSGTCCKGLTSWGCSSKAWWWQTFTSYFDDKEALTDKDSLGAEKWEKLKLENNSKTFEKVKRGNLEKEVTPFTQWLLTSLPYPYHQPSLPLITSGPHWPPFHPIPHSPPFHPIPYTP